MSEPILKYNLKTLYYPGAGFDFETLKYFIENSTVKKFYYCDYMNFEITPDRISEEMRIYFELSDYDTSLIADLRPKYFGKNEWIGFWYKDTPMFGGSIANSFALLFKIKKGKKSWDFIYLGTEAIQTYEVLVQNNIKLDVVVTQDHGFGGLWTTFCKGSKLEEISHNYNKMPMILHVGENHEAWNSYSQISDRFGYFGIHQNERIFYKLNDAENNFASIG